MNKPGSILVLRFSSIGDIVLTTSPLRRLRQAFPEARLDFMTLKEFAPILEGHPDIDRLICLDREAAVGEIMEVSRRLRSSDYDLLVDLHNTLRAKIIRRRMNGIPALVFKKPRLKRFLLFRLKKNRFAPDFTILKSLNDVLNPAIDQSIVLPPTSLYISAVEKSTSMDFVAGHGVKRKFVVMIPGAAWPQKQWQADKFADVANKINDKFDLDVVLLGTSQDEICDRIQEKSPKVVNLKGLTSLRESMAVVANSIAVIGNDTGLSHIAEALGIPVVMILGPTSRETGAGSNRADSSVIQINLDCRPCSQNGKRPCYRKEQYCMTRITSDQVFQEAGKLFESC